MAKQMRQFDVPRTVRHDAQTGRDIWKVSPAGTRCVASYMYINSFTADDKRLFYMGRCGDAWQLFLCDIASGRTTQLTDEQDVGAHGANIHPVTQELFYRAGLCYWAIDLDTFERRLVLDTERVPWLHKPSEQIMFSKTGRYFSFAYQTDDDLRGIGRARCDGSGAESVFVRPRGERTQHVQFAYADDDLMSFAVHPDYQQEWHLDDAKRARAWLLDAATGAVEPFLVMPPPCTATHEYWGASGERMYFHKKTRPTWVPTWICSLDRRTREQRILFGSDSIKLGHSAVNRAETRLVSDSQQPNRNELILIDLATGHGEVLCWPNSTVCDGQEGHVHPSFSALDNYVLYTSDVSGEAQVYLVSLRQ